MTRFISYSNSSDHPSRRLSFVLSIQPKRSMGSNFESQSQSFSRLWDLL